MRSIFKVSRRCCLSTLAAAVLLAACGGGVEDDRDRDHQDIRIDTSGRLATIEAGARVLRIHDLDSGSVEASHTLDHVPAAVYASASGRYAVVMQRTQDQVQFVDGGIWQEDHVDHLHDFKQASKVVAFKLAGPLPTHYDVQAGRQSAIFMDGNSSANPVQNASVHLFTDVSIGSGNTVARLDLSVPIHGLAEPVGDKLLAVARAADASDTLPTHLVLYTRNGDAYALGRQIATRCDGMHGSFSSGSSSLVGCIDGMLLVRHTGATTVNEGQKLTTPLRVGTIAGHARLPDHFIGIATEGAAPSPVTTRFYAVNGEAATVSDFTPQGWATGRVRRAHGFDRSGQRFFVLDDQGTLIGAQRQGGSWVNLSRVGAAIPTMPTAAPWPAIAANGARDELYITDPVARQLVVINSSTGAVIARRELGFAPSNLTWLGITR